MPFLSELTDLLCRGVNQGLRLPLHYGGGDRLKVFVHYFLGLFTSGGKVLSAIPEFISPRIKGVNGVVNSNDPVAL